MEYIKLIVKGFFMGIANIIPGVSGGTLAITLGIYEKLIDCISNLFKNFKENLKFLIPVAIGMVLSILTMSNVIIWALENKTLPTALLFSGLVIGGIPLLLKKVKGFKIKLSYIITFLITFALVLVLALLPKIMGDDFSNVVLDYNIFNLIKVLIVGIIAASTMIIPGVSGSLVLMLLGYYDTVVGAIKELTHFENVMLNLVNLGIFGIGVIIGIIFVAKILEWLFKRHEVITYYGILGFIFASVIAIFISISNEYIFIFSPSMIIVGIVLFIVGLFGGYKLGDM